MKPSILSLLCLLVTFSNAEEIIRFEDGSESAAAPFRYDPLLGKSEPNQASLNQFSPNGYATGLAEGASFTIEAFAKPADELSTKPRDLLPVFALADGETTLLAGIRRSPAPHSYNWWNVRIRNGSAPPLDVARNRYKGISMVKENSRWHHLAVTWESDSKTLSFFLDYQLQQQAILEVIPEWDLSKIEIGSSSAFSTPFQGAIDEVRVTDRVLDPWHFLRTSDTELTDVSFAPEENPGLPAGYGHVDVRLHYGAVGDGVHDDTAAIQRAFAENENRVPNEYKTVYFPEGTYLISDMIRFSRFMVVRGAREDRTVIRLQDRAKGYDNPEIPKAAFAVGYDWPYVDRTKKQRAGNVIGNYLFDLSIDTGSGNPAALGLDFHCNNLGCVENVRIRSGDGGGLVGLDFKRGWPGPCLIKNVSISGFDYGIDAGHREYSLVFSDIRLSNQRVAAIRNRGNILSMEKVISENRVPVIENSSSGLITMMRSVLRGGNDTATAIQSTNASLYLRDIEIEGYGISLHETRSSEKAPPEELSKHSNAKIEEYFTGPQDSAFPSDQTGSLKLENQGNTHHLDAPGQNVDECQELLRPCREWKLGTGDSGSRRLGCRSRVFPS